MSLNSNVKLSKSLIFELVKIGVRDFCLCPGARNAPLIHFLDFLKNQINNTFNNQSGNPFNKQINNQINFDPLAFFTFFDERAAAFFALGRTLSNQRPCVIVTTSGTAVAELLPAAVEACYTSQSLIFLTADRPRNYRGTGAPQSINQLGIFGEYVESTFDIASLEDSMDLTSWSQKKPLHINVCFDEPLGEKITEEMISVEDILEIFKDERIQADSLQRIQKKQEMSSTDSFRDKSIDEKILKNTKKTFLENLNKTTNKFEKPIVIVAALNEEERNFIIPLLKEMKVPIYAESLSGLRGESQLADQLLVSEKTIIKGFEKDWFRSVIRIGGIPTLRFWRDLEQKYLKIPVLSFSRNSYPGLAREGVSHFHYKERTLLKNRWNCFYNGKDGKDGKEGKEGKENSHFFDINLFNINKKKLANENFLDIFDYDKNIQAKQEKLLNLHPLSEPFLIREFVQWIPSDQTIYLGNSLPVREWDLISPANKKFRSLCGNRGVNGIDGQVSTFLGWSSCQKEKSWAFLGDLTTMYDLNALWITPQLASLRASVSSFQGEGPTIVVVNNQGGKIFQNMFKSKVFLNEHSISFEPWARMFDWDYYSCSSSEMIKNFFLKNQNQNQDQDQDQNKSEADSLKNFISKKPRVIELKPDSEQTQNFWKELTVLS